MTEDNSGDGIYFSPKEIGIILALSILAALSGALVPSGLFPEDRMSNIVYNGLHLPGPGAGVMIFGSILCFWLLLGLIIVKKPGTAAAMAVVLVAVDLLFGNQAIVLQSVDVLVFVAIIIEVLHLVPVNRYHGEQIMPLIFIALSAATVLVALACLATQGETDGAVTQFPGVYYAAGFLGFLWAYIIYRFPVRYLVAAGVANMYYMLHFWLFWGAGIATRFPPDPVMVPVLLLVALLGGVIAASAAYGVELLLNRYIVKMQSEERSAPDLGKI